MRFTASLRRRLLVVSAALATSASIVLAPGTDAQPAADELQPLASCIRDERRVAALFLIDESGSLDTTDPEASRVTGVKAALAGLNELTQGEGAAEVQVALWGFSVAATERQAWTALGPETLRPLQDAAEAFRERDTGFDTDYISALDSARSALAARVTLMDPEGGAPVCKLLLWFTDGKLDVDDRLTATAQERYGTTKPWAPDIDLTRRGAGDQASERGRELMCAPDGTMQKVRDDGVFTAIVALETAIDQVDRQLLAAAANGTSSSGTPCGAGGAEADESGAYIAAADVDDLIFGLFEAVGVTPVPPGRQERGACPDPAPCPEGTLEFALDEGLSRFNLLALSSAPEIEVVLTGPTGEAASLGRSGDAGVAGSADIAGADISYAWLSPNTTLVTGRLPADVDSWTGTWQVTFVDTTGRNPDVRNHVALYLFGDLEGRVVPDTTLRKGVEGEIVIRIVNADGQPQTSAAFVRGSRLVATIGAPGEVPDPLRLSAPRPDGTFVATFTPSEELSATTLVVHTELTIETSAGVTLPTVTADDTIPVRPPPGFPTIELDDKEGLMLSSVTERDGVARGQFTVVGADEGSSCVWFAGSRARSRPTGVDSVEYSTDTLGTNDDCLTVGAGERVEVTVEGGTSGAGRGRVAGDLLVGMRSAISGEERTEEVPVRFEMSVDPVVDPDRFLALLLAGIGVPLISLYALNWETARFTPFDSIRYLAVDVAVRRSGVDRLDGRQPVLDGEEVDTIAGVQSFRAFQLGRLSFRSRMPRSPFGTATGRVAASEGARVATQRGVLGDGREAVVPLGLGRVWVLVVDDEELRRVRIDPSGELEGEVRASVVALFGRGTTFDEQLKDIESEFVGAAPDLAVALAACLRREEPPAPDDHVPVDRTTPASPGGIDSLPPLPGTPGRPGPEPTPPLPPTQRGTPRPSPPADTRLPPLPPV